MTPIAPSLAAGMATTHAAPTVLRATASQGIIKTITYLVIEHFAFLRNLGTGGLGAKELAVDTAWMPPAEGKKPTRTYYATHGVLYLCSGACGAAAAAHSLGIKTFCAYSDKLGKVSMELFVAANLFTLVESTIRLRAALHKFVESNSDEHYKECLSAALSILSSLGYLAAAAASMLGATTAIILTFGVFASATGSLAVVYDFCSSPFFTSFQKSESHLCISDFFDF